VSKFRDVAQINYPSVRLGQPSKGSHGARKLGTYRCVAGQGIRKEVTYVQYEGTYVVYLPPIAKPRGIKELIVMQGVEYFCLSLCY
jgi:hypothetical protein